MKSLKTMKPLHINFAAPSLLRAALETHPLAYLLGVLGVAFCTAAILAGLAQRREYQTYSVELQRMQAKLDERNTRRPAPKKPAIPEAQAAAVNAAIAQLNLPWRDLLDAIETATPVNIALLALEPEAKKHLIKGSAEAKTSDAMIAYIEQLKQQTFFDAVTLSKHEVNEQDPNRPIRFQFEAQWAHSAP